MENEEILELDWMPNDLDAVFDDIHAHTKGQWETQELPKQDDSQAA
ncbi:hypothetical protein MWU49_17460 [Alcanivorax sp. S6407]|nr:hypothetical protein [Alcanivorax sp. S6407]MCK0155506.1 hypothetical protein [Alcanivorax sp. S6407]